MDAQLNLGVILDHVGDGVTVQDQSGRLVYVNAAAAQSLGFASAAELLSTPVPEVVARFAIFDEAGAPFSLENLPGRRALTGEEEATVTVRFRIHATGEERWSTIRASPVRDAEGEVQFAVNVWQDATEPKRSEAGQRFLAEAGEALASSLDVEATLINIAQLAVPRLADWCAVHLVRDDGMVSQVTVIHSDPEKVALAQELQERYPSDPKSDRGVAGVIRSGTPELIPDVTEEMLVALARDAEHLAMLRSVGLTSALIVPMLAHDRTLGAITFIAAESGRRYDERDLHLAQDLARRAALAIENAHLYDAERAARVLAEDARVRFRALFEGTPDAILVVDAGNRLIEANTAACQLLGYELDELLARRIDELVADAAVASNQFSRLADEERVESEVVRKDGSRIPVEIWSRRLSLPAGPIVIGVLRDTSDRREADQIREELLSAISHDLRSPLSAIKLHAQSLQRLVRRGGDLDAGRLDDGLAAIDTMSTRVASLLEDIVELARARDSQGVPFNPEPTDLVALAHRCATEAGSAAVREVRVESPVASLVGMWDASGIERVVLNLLNNAVKYSPAGSEVSVRVEQIETTAGPWAVLEVRDAGIGIPAADLPRIFERYRRGRNVGAIGGTGLGLTGSKQIVERHAGAIEIASEEGRGTTVTVRLPLMPDTTHETAPAQP